MARLSTLLKTPLAALVKDKTQNHLFVRLRGDED